LEASRERLAITPADVLAGYSPLHHNMGLVRYAFGAVHAGCPAHLVPPSIANIPAWLKMVSHVRATITSGSDYAYRAATQLIPPGSIDLSSLRMAVSGGEPVRLTTIRSFEERFGFPGIIRPAYGLAEATLTVTSMAVGEALRVDSSGTVSCGRPLRDTHVRVVDEHGRETAAFFRLPRR
jgi:acyl-coenzyme A synthetase/AMP-(fatty) acid ligase